MIHPNIELDLRSILGPRTMNRESDAARGNFADFL
jgi:hypothetical protein